MFDGSLVEVDGLKGADDAAVVAAIAGWARVEAAAGARRLAAVAELARRRAGENAYWSCDGWDCAAGEVAAALTVSHGRTCGQTPHPGAPPSSGTPSSPSSTENGHR